MINLNQLKNIYIINYLYKFNKNISFNKINIDVYQYEYTFIVYL